MVRVYSLIALDESVEYSIDEQRQLLLAMPIEEGVLCDENGAALYELHEHAALEDMPAAFVLPEGDYFISAECEGFEAIAFEPLQVAYADVTVLEIEIQLVALPSETQQPASFDNCRVTFTGMPEGAQVALFNAETEIMAEEDGSYLLVPGEYTYNVSCEGFAAIENAGVVVDGTLEMMEIVISMQPLFACVNVTPVCADGARLLRVYVVNEAGEAVEFIPDESGVYQFAPGEYLYDVLNIAYETVATCPFVVDGLAESMELAVDVVAPVLNPVVFDIWQENTLLSVYRFREDGTTQEFQPDEYGCYNLPAGEYFYDASLEGHASVSCAPFTVFESAGETQHVCVWLLSDERANVERSQNVLIFAVKSGSSAQAHISAELQQTLDALGVISADYFYTMQGDSGYESVYYAMLNNDDVWYAADMLSAHGDIAYAEPDYIYHTSEDGEFVIENAWATGDQSYMGHQPWVDEMGMRSIWGELESNKIAPGEGTIVAVIDTGVDYTHPDLAPNMWVNTAELNGSGGVDDDGNGYVDDIYGYDFVSNDGNPDDDHGHGTHVAGIIAMADNNTGGVGMAYGAQVMAIKAGQATGTFASSSIARAVLYAKANGADVINMSFGGYSPATVVENALQSAFADCVLVAAAGNDGAVTTDAPPSFNPRGDMYPAGYSFVLGVMATDISGKHLTGFSNWDWNTGENCEYEIAAPGSGIYSTLPGGRYAKWSGTSMAAPMVSAAAAVIRSQKGANDAYSNRYIIGQLVGATSKYASNDYNSYPSLNLMDALKYVPTPQLTVTGVKLFDSVEFSDVNNGDGVWQNGETIELGLEITNRWGAASEISITADGLTDAGDPGFITFEDNTAAIGAVGTYATANTGYIYNDGELTGVSDPIRFTIGADVANNVEIPINIHVTAKNDMDENDKTIYEAEDYTYVLTIENGNVISGVLTEDTTLTADRMWIIRGTLQVPEGVTLTVEPGTYIHFERVLIGNDSIDKDNYPILQILGSANMIGTEASPIRLTSDSVFGIVGSDGHGFGAIEYSNITTNGTWNAADCTMAYVIIETDNSHVLWESKYSPTVGYLVSWGNSYYTAVAVKRIEHCEFTNVLVFASESISSSRLINSAVQNEACYDSNVSAYLCASMYECILQGSGIIGGYHPFTVKDCVYNSSVNVKYNTSQYNSGSSDTTIINNAILNQLNDADSWYRPISQSGNSISFANNYWGTENTELISEMILDSSDILTYGTIDFLPVLSKDDSSLESIYPFVLDAWVEDAEGNRIDTIAGAQTCTFHVLFNRAMDTSVQPSVCYGQAEPYNDYRLRGSWVSSREWVAIKTVNPLIDYGTQYFCIEGAVAASDSWLVTGRDTRLWFNITNMSAEALVLQSWADAEGIHLDWTQDDFETLAGYNIYRYQKVNSSTGEPTDLKKINRVLIPSDVLEYTDTDVVEGETYYYYFTVVQTDFNESDGSNVSACTALDMTAPVIVHSIVDSAIAGETIPISATVTDNVKIDSVTLYFRTAGADTWNSTDMTNTTDSLWFASIATNGVGSIEYYIDAFDGVGHAFKGSAEAPNVVTVRAEAAAAGDVNMDATVDIMDLMMIAHSIAGTTELSANQTAVADVNDDGCVDIFDLMRVAQYVCGIIDSL